MKNIKILLPALLAVVLAFSLMPFASIVGTSANLHLSDDHSIVSAVNSPSAASTMALNTPQWQATPMVAAGFYHTVGLKADGTVIALGYKGLGQSDVENWNDIVQVAAGSYHTVGCKVDGTVLAAGPDIELAKWNLGVVEYSLTISSTPNGSVTTPGAGAFTYNAGLVVRVIAEPEKGYRFVNWTGDVDTIANANAATTIITMHGDYAITANFARNWPLIGGVTAAVVVAAGLAIFFVRRRRTAGTKKRKKRATRKKRR